MRIAVGSLNGGVGSTTLSVNLAYALQRAGHRVAVVDAGPGQSVLRWMSRRDIAGLGRMECGLALPAHESSEREAAYMVIDVGAGQQSVMRALPIVDIWLAPTPPSFPEYTSTLQLYRMWCAARGTSSKAGLFVAALVRVGQNESDLDRAARRHMSSADDGFHLLNQSLSRHPAWDETYGGHALHELPKHVAGRALFDFSMLLVELLALGLVGISKGHLPPFNRSRYSVVDAQ